MGTRSVLFTPGDEESMVRKSLESGVDVVVIDFEDAVSPANKEQARETAETILSEIEDVTPQIWIRINQLETGGARDIAAIDSVETMPDEIVLPMVNSSTDIRELETTLDSHGIELGVIGILETAAGVHRVDDIVERDSLSGVIFGAEDFTADMGIVELQDQHHLDCARSRIAIAAVSAGINAIDTVYTDIEDAEGLRADAERALNFGFDGKVAIHPAQVDIIEDVFTPSEAAIEWARKVLIAAEESDSGVFEVDGQMIDAPVISRAQEIMNRADDQFAQ